MTEGLRIQSTTWNHYFLLSLVLRTDSVTAFINAKHSTLHHVNADNLSKFTCKWDLQKLMTYENVRKDGLENGSNKKFVLCQSLAKSDTIYLKDLIRRTYYIGLRPEFDVFDEVRYADMACVYNNDKDSYLDFSLLNTTNDLDNFLFHVGNTDLARGGYIEDPALLSLKANTSQFAAIGWHSANIWILPRREPSKRVLRINTPMFYTNLTSNLGPWQNQDFLYIHEKGCPRIWTVVNSCNSEKLALCTTCINDCPRAFNSQNRVFSHTKMKQWGI